jgi:hypothetical protein
MKLLFISSLAVTTAFGSLSYSGDRETMSLGFGSGWELGWREKRFAASPTRYVVVEDNGREVLMALSRKSASALWTPLGKQLDEGDELSWRWKVTRGLTRVVDERVKTGDDYSARVLVAFDADPFSKSTRALCYVWAKGQPKGAVYENPYSDNVATIVVRSGESGVGEWVTESRNVVADYRRAFGENPSKIYALAIMVDTDDTKSLATAWFSDIALVSTDLGPERRR